MIGAILENNLLEKDTNKRYHYRRITSLLNQLPKDKVKRVSTIYSIGYQPTHSISLSLSLCWVSFVLNISNFFMLFIILILKESLQKEYISSTKQENIQ